MTYQDILTSLSRSYDQGAEYRDNLPLFPWKIDIRQAFLERIKAENKTRLLEVGAGAGRDGLFFQDNGLEVVCMDLSAEMVKRCQSKGLHAYQGDFLNLNQPQESFDALYAMNCLLHVPASNLPTVLSALADVLKPGGLFFLSAYAGDSEGLWPDDSHHPPRFFALRSQATMERFLAVDFDIIDFQLIELEKENAQVFTLRKPEAKSSE